MGEIIIEESNYRAFALLLANLFMLVAAIAISIFGMTRGRIMYIIPGLAAAIVFFGGLIYSISKAVKVKKLLTITMEGIIDSSPMGGIGFIPYDDIKEFQIVNLYRNRAIAVIPKNIDTFLSKLSAVKRRQVKRNINIQLPPVTINVELAKDMEPEDILSLLQKRLLDYSRLFD